MPAPAVVLPTTAPSRDMPSDVYVPTANAWAASLPAFGASLEAIGEYVDEVAGDLDTILAGAGFVGTSTTSMTIGAGPKSLTVQEGLTFRDGSWVELVDQANSDNWMWMQALYNPATGAMSGTVPANGFSGSGAKTAWNVILSGPMGATGLDAGIGKHAIPIPATAMSPAITNGAGLARVATTTNAVLLTTLDFDPATQEIAHCSIAMPKAWNEGTVTFKVVWKHAATTTNFGVAFGLSAVACGDGDAGDAAYGTQVIVTDTGGTTNTIYHTAESAAVTIAGTPQPQDLVFFRLQRIVADAADTMAIDAGVLALVLYITTDAGNDA